MTYYSYNGADRGAKITIKKSTFKNSRFCKGMIFYRPSFNYYYDGFSSIVNYTNLYMTEPQKNIKDSFLIISDSTFTNLNAFS